VSENEAGTPPDVRGRLGHLAAALSPGERLAAIGALAIPLTFLFPWYGFKLGSPLSSTAIASFGWGHLALLTTGAAALLVVLMPHLGRAIPRPLERGALVITAGVWACVILAYLMADPPDLLVGINAIGGVRLRYGIFAAAAAAIAIVVGGARMRGERPDSP
jgi:hypothetical protein